MSEVNTEWLVAPGGIVEVGNGRIPLNFVGGGWRWSPSSSSEPVSKWAPPS